MRPRKARSSSRSPPGPAPESAGRWGRREWLVAGLLVGVTVATFSLVFQCGFVSYDDPLHVTANEHVQAGLTWDNAVWALTELNGSWHPLAWWSWMLDVQLYGLNPVGFHATNLLWHVASVVLLFATLRRMTGDIWPSALAAALFAVHPMNVESVAWISERKGLVSTFFAVLTLAAYSRYAQRPALARYLLVALCLALGLMAKAMLTTLPLVLLLLDFWPLRRWQLPSFPRSDAAPAADLAVLPGKPTPLGWLIAEKIPLLVLAIGCSVVAVIAQRHVGALASLDSAPLDVRVTSAVTSYVIYLWRAIYPVQLAAFYPLPEVAEPWWKVAGAAALLLAITGVAVWQARRLPPLLVGWLWYLGTLFPVIGLVQVGGHAQADRYSYLPFIGLFIAASWAVADLARRWRREQLAAGLAAVALAALALLSFAQVEHWRSGFALWEQSIRVTGGSSRAWYNLGILWLEQGEFATASRCFQQAQQLDPHSSEVRSNLGLALYGLKDYAGAAREFQEVLRVTPQDTKARTGAGLVLLNLGDYAQAAVHFQEVVRLSPDSPEALTAFNALAETYAADGQLTQAVATARQAIIRAKAAGQTALARQIELRLAAYEQGRSPRKVETAEP